MARLLVVHHDVDILRQLARLVEAQHEYMAIDNLATGVKYIPKIDPEAIVVGHEAQKRDGIRLLRFMKEQKIDVPTVVVRSPDSGTDAAELRQLGAFRVVDHPINDRALNNALAFAANNGTVEISGIPSLTEEEIQGNLTFLEKELNDKMQCFAGRNKVYIQSLISGRKRGKPRIALKCPLRAERNLQENVYYEFIRDVCCGNPKLCEAVQRFEAERDHV